MTIKVYNTLAREKQEFVPIDPKNVRMYVCGPTVYDLAHIGNARPVVVFDVLSRLLRVEYGAEHVTYVRNITDVEDKIIEASLKSGEPIESITKRTTQAYHDDMAALGALEPDIEPRATDHIQEMIDMSAELIRKGHAYEAEGHVLFSVSSMADYGELSRRNRDDMIAGARVEVAPYKKDPADFVLWKPSSEEQPGWDSPWGKGRPGWHIECSAMSRSHLGETFDLHGGGLDLTFPHHENEIAQSRCCNDKPYVNYWMHNGYVVVNGEKMSKSLGNFFTVRQLLDEGLNGEALRLTLLSGHYRQPLDVTREKVAEFKTQLDRFYGALQSVAKVDANTDQASEAFLEALRDDLNTPLALSVLHDITTELNKTGDDRKSERKKLGRLKGELLAGGYLLGIIQQDPEVWFKGSGEDSSEIESLIAERIEAKKARDFARADAIRDQLSADGIELLDSPQGTSWRRK
ncbi:cysteine--tRNA ligase [Kiloniella laminariae]|uniref:Cysteine--tRNA ligase n=1 Tax=Kiloniella laminariae TaxID=454162 RepID=A0ABT4LHQ9_9PROT|nr:cysteine--tRNA ligase [Kiloniella laminariae]MCZ4280626.1 cysteine--tRNA ligase [Kiloniella laminariae]